MSRTPPSPALVVACVALFVALSGSAIALNKKSVGTAQLKGGAVSAPKLKNGAVIGRKLRDGAVKTPKLRADAVTADKIATAAVTSSRLANDSVRRRKIAGSAVTGAKLANGAVREAKLANGAVTGPKLAANSVAGANVVDGSLGLADVARTVETESVDPDPVAAGVCASQTAATVGSQDGQPTLVLTGAGWDNRLLVAAAESEANQTAVLICNPTGATVDGSEGQLIFARF